MTGLKQALGLTALTTLLALGCHVPDSDDTLDSVQLEGRRGGHGSGTGNGTGNGDGTGSGNDDSGQSDEDAERAAEEAAEEAAIDALQEALAELDGESAGDQEAAEEAAAEQEAAEQAAAEEEAERAAREDEALQTYLAGLPDEERARIEQAIEDAMRAQEQEAAELAAVEENQRADEEFERDAEWNDSFPQVGPLTDDERDQLMEDNWLESLLEDDDAYIPDGSDDDDGRIELPDGTIYYPYIMPPPPSVEDVEESDQGTTLPSDYEDTLPE